MNAAVSQWNISEHVKGFRTQVLLDDRRWLRRPLDEQIAVDVGQPSRRSPQRNDGRPEEFAERCNCDPPHNTAWRTSLRCCTDDCWQCDILVGTENGVSEMLEENQDRELSPTAFRSTATSMTSLSAGKQTL
jgi:hypothetical protein